MAKDKDTSWKNYLESYDRRFSLQDMESGGRFTVRKIQSEYVIEDEHFISNKMSAYDLAELLAGKIGASVTLKSKS